MKNAETSPLVFLKRSVAGSGKRVIIEEKACEGRSA